MIARVSILLTLGLSTISYAQNAGSDTRAWSGTLFDTARTDCSTEVAHSAAPGTCPVSMCTQHFGIKLPDGKLYKFDEGSNPKAVDALRQSKKGSRIVYDYWRTGKTAKPITARVTGSLTSDTLNLENIKVD